MPNIDTPTQAAVEGHFAPAWFTFMDFSGDPLRVTNYISDVTFSATGDADLDGNTFLSWGGTLLSVGDVTNSDSGSDTLEVTLSGITSIDTALMADIGDRSLWQGRTARFWFQVYDAAGDTPQGAIVSHYTGYMSSVSLSADPGSNGQPGTQTITLSIENYLAYTVQASNRDYLSQSDYDPLDTSAAATIAAANGIKRNTGASGGGGNSMFDYGLASRNDVRLL